MPPTKKKIAPAQVQQQVTADSLANLLTGMGDIARDKRRSTFVVRSAAADVTELDTRFTEGDLEHNIVSIPAEDMTREWVDLQGRASTKSNDKAGDAPSTIEARLDAIGARSAMKESLCWSRLTGGAIVVVGLAGQKSAMAPNRDGAMVPTGEPDLSIPAQPGRVEWLQVYDRFEVGNVTFDRNGNPATYTVTTDSKATVVHASRVLRFTGDPMPRRMRESAGWGLSVIERCKEHINNLDTVLAGVTVAGGQFSETVVQFDKLTALLAQDKGTVAKNRIAMMNMMRSAWGMMVLDADDKIAEVSRDFSGIPEVLNTLVERVASAARMPVSLLMGRSPGGLNATGDTDVRFWYSHIGSMQESDLRPPLWRLVELVAIGEGIDIVDVGLSMTFRPLWQPTMKEQAETHYTQAQADAVYAEIAGLTPEEIRRSRFAKTGWSVETVVDEDDEIDASKVDDKDLDPNSLDENGDPVPTASAAGGVDVQKTALNGAQVASMQGIVTSVAKGELPRDSGVAMLALAFQLTSTEADAVMGSAGRSFKPTTDTPTTAP